MPACEMRRVQSVTVMGMPRAQSEHRVSAPPCILFMGFAQAGDVARQEEEFWQTIPSPVKSLLIFTNIEANGGGVS